MDKEIILFIFDYEDYLKGSYELSEYENYFVGQKAYSFKQLLTLIENKTDCHVPKEERIRLMNFFWDNNEKNIDIVEEIKMRINYNQ